MPRPKPVGPGPKLKALPGTTLAVFSDIALGSSEVVVFFKPAYDWKPWLGVLAAVALDTVSGGPIGGVAVDFN